MNKFKLFLVAAPVVFCLSCKPAPSLPAGGSKSRLGRVDIQPIKNPKNTAIPNSDLLMLGHDFGTILSHGQTLHHEFELENKSDQPLALFGASAMTPCCSSIGPLPNEIPPRGRVSIPVEYKPGQRTGPGRVAFVVHSGSDGRREIRLNISATLVSDLEIVATGEAMDRLAVGQSAKRRLEVICRQLGGDGLEAPLSVRASGDFVAQFASDPRSKKNGDMTEHHLEVSVEIPASDKIGRHEGSVALFWPTGFEYVYPIAWEVNPPVRMTPTAFVFRADEGKISRDLMI